MSDTTTAPAGASPGDGNVVTGNSVDSSTSGHTVTDTTTTADPDWKAEAEKWKTQARKHEERAKANASAAKELDEFRKASMTEQEKAVESARAEGRAAALVEFGSQLVDAKFEAAAAGRLEADQLQALLDGVDRTKFLSEDGTVDAGKVAAFVDGIAPKPAEGTQFPDLGQGARGSEAMALNGDPLLRDLKSKLGIR